MQSVRCHSCGHDVESESLRLKYGGACPHCLGAFALEGLLTPAAPAASSVTSGTTFGKFALTDLLGQGGMGEVWKAFDGELKRWVALKFLRAESPQELARFQREARTAAGLSHPGIAAIHEVGEAGGRHYIAMQFIEGTTLQHHPRSDRKGLARLVRDAARALEHAHRHGVIHRDLKPENLMVEKGPDGDRVILLDFGLARQIKGGERLSQTGTVAGTLVYMSPEQARGEKLDQRTDVYSLGATLYDVLTGRPPFEGPTPYEIMRRIENEEPVAARRWNPHIAHDLETITLKCLEKNRERRYASAKQLADDLERFLEGDAIHARRASTWYRVRKKLGKRKLVVSTIGIAAVIVSALLGWWAFVGSPETAHANLYAEAMKLWAEARGEAMAGVHPAAIAEKAGRARGAFEKAIEAKEDARSQVMRGRCLALEGKSEKAQKAFERAHEVDAANAEAGLELSKALLLTYVASRGTPPILQIRLYGLPGSLFRFGDLPEETEGERQWRKRSERLMATGEVEPAQAALRKGLLAMGQGGYDRAAKALALYTKAERWDAQALNLEGVCLFHAKEYSDAIAILSRSIGRVATPMAYQYRALAHFALRQMDDATGDFTRVIESEASDEGHASAYVNRGVAKSAKGLYNEAIADYDHAIRLNPKLAPAYINRGSAKDNKDLFDEAIADGDKAIALDPKSAVAFLNRGGVKLSKGRYDEAIADCDKAIQLDPKHAVAYDNRGYAKESKGLYDEAIADFDKAIELDPMLASAYVNRGSAKRSQDRFDEAIADCDRAIELDPKLATAYSNRGDLKQTRGRHDEAIADCDRALELDPKLVSAFVNRGNALYAKGRLDEAITDYGKAIELNPRHAMAHGNRGLAKAIQRLYDEAIADCDQAITLDPKLARTYVTRGNAKCGQGRLDDAIADYDAAIRLDPKLPLVHVNRGNARLGLGRYDDAIADYHEAIRLDPKCAPAYYGRAAAKSRKGLRREAISDYLRSIDLNPEDTSAYFNVACGHALLGETKEALDWLEKAIGMGYRNLAHLERDSDLESLRKEERYKKLVAKLKGE